MPVLETERLALRRMTADDAAFMLELTNDPDWLRHIGDRGIRSVDDARAYIENGTVASYSRFGFGAYVVELKESGEAIGICGLIRRDWLEDVDLAFAFLPRFRGKGYAHEAASATLEYARSALGLGRIVAIVSPENEGSIRLLEKLGLSFERMAVPPQDTREICVFTPRAGDAPPP